MISSTTQSSILICQRNRVCHNCQRPIEKYSLYVAGASLDKHTGYTGGYFHLDCYVSKNHNDYAKGKILMSQKTYDELGLPEITSFEDADELTREWTMQQGELLNKTFIITDYMEIEAYDEPALLANAYIDEKLEMVLINSVVLMKELKRVKKHLPIKVTIRKVKNYYTFS